MEAAALPFIIISILLSVLNIILRLLKSRKINLARLEEKKKHLEDSLKSLKSDTSTTTTIENIIIDTDELFSDLIDLYENLEFK